MEDMEDEKELTQRRGGAEGAKSFEKFESRLVPSCFFLIKIKFRIRETRNLQNYAPPIAFFAPLRLGEIKFE